MADFIKLWWLAIRPHTLSASCVPVLVGSALAFKAGSFTWVLFFSTLLGSLLVQIGTNLTDEYSDHGAGASALKYPAPHKVIARGLLSWQKVRIGAMVSFGLAALVGTWLVWVTGWPLLLVCLGSLGVAYAYSAGPFPLGDYALGEALVFLVMGPVMVGGTYYVQTGKVDWETILISLPVGGLVTAILVVNNLRDREEDRQSGRHTLATVFGAAPVKGGYHGLLLMVYLIPALAILIGGRSYWLWLPWLTLPLAFRLAVWIQKSPDRETLHRALKGTSALHLIFGLLLTAALLAGMT